MKEVKLDTITTDAAGAARELAEVTRDVASRAAVYARRHGNAVSQQVRGLAADAGELLEGWMSGARGTLRSRPLPVLAVAVLFGYVIGRLLKRS